MQVRGTSYLIPIDARLASDTDAEDEAVWLDRLMQDVEHAGGRPKRLRMVSMVILDACRDNPFVRTMRVARAGQAGSGPPPAASGLGAVQSRASEMLVGFATRPGRICADGGGELSTYTQALLRSLTVPGLDVRLAFGRVRDDVLKATQSRQEPFVYGSLQGGVVSLVPAPAQAQSADGGMAKADYDRVAKIGTKKAFEVFIGTYRTGFYADLARAQIEELNKREQVRVATTDDPYSQPLPSSQKRNEAVLPERAADASRQRAEREAAASSSVRSRMPPNVGRQRAEAVRRAEAEAESKRQATQLSARRAEDERRAEETEFDRQRSAREQQAMRVQRAERRPMTSPPSREPPAQGHVASPASPRRRSPRAWRRAR
jgi:hypothetical protein